LLDSVIYVIPGLLYILIFSHGFNFIFSETGEKSDSKTTYFVSSGTLNLNWIYQ